MYLPSPCAIGMVNRSLLANKLVKGVLLFFTIRSVHLQTNRNVSFLINAPGRRFDSTNIWNPLHIPNIGIPFIDAFFTAFMIGECDAIIPALNLSPNENPPGTIIASNLSRLSLLYQTYSIGIS